MADLTPVAKSGEALLAELHETNLPPGQMAFWWFGQLTYLLRFGASVAMVDAYLKPDPRRRTPALLAPEQCKDVQVFLCTHDHSDHIDPWAIPLLVEHTTAPFVVPRAVGQRLLDLGVPEARLMLVNAGESIEVAGLQIDAIASAHEFLSRTPEGLYPFLGYVIRGNGVSLYHSGDTVWWEGLQAELIARRPIDVACVPINGRDGQRYRRNTIGNMSFAEACDLVCQVPVGLAVPAHYDMFEGNLEDPSKFTDFCAAKYPGQGWWVGPAGQRVIVQAGSGVTL